MAWTHANFNAKPNTGAENAFTFWTDPVGQTLIEPLLEVNLLEESSV